MEHFYFIFFTEALDKYFSMYLKKSTFQFIYVSLFSEFPLRLFSVVTSITNSVFHKVVKKSTKIQKQSQPTESHSPQKQSPKHQTQSEISKRVRIK